MKRSIIALTATALAVGSAGMASAKPGKGQDNGAQKAGLSAVSATAPLSDCKAAEGAGKQTPTGFVVLNAPGTPGAPKKIVGEVAVKQAEPGTYDVRLAAESGCGTDVGDLVVGPNGQGNARIAAAGQGAGTYYVTLTQQPLSVVPVAGELVTQQFYASAPVQLR